MASKDVAMTKVEHEVEKHLLSVTVKLSDGTTGFIFSRNPHRNENKLLTYNCHLCSVPNLPGESCLHTHIRGRRHQTKLSQHTFDANLFRAPLQRSNKIVMQIAPGEPVPPGFENEVKPVAELQAKIEKCKDMSLIGLEYLLELTMGEGKEPSYMCLLCEKRGDPRTIMDHITSYKHRLKYMEKHFPTVTREIATFRYNRDSREILPKVIQTICESIEDAYGRLAPNVYDNEVYEKNRMACLQETINDKHFDEKMGSTFLNAIDRKAIAELQKDGSILPAAKRISPPAVVNKAPNRGRISNERRRSLDSISSISSSSLDRNSRSPSGNNRRSEKRKLNDENDDVIIVGSKSRSPTAFKVRQRERQSDFRTKSRRISPENIRSRNRSRSRSPRNKSPENRRKAIPTPRELSTQAAEIGAERYKWEKYRCTVEIAVKELEKMLAVHEKSPESHPMYPEEWKIFWNRRYKELQAEKKDPAKYDFKPEWVDFWMNRIRELHDEAVKKKKEEIRKKFNLPKDGKERTNELKEQYAIKTVAKPNAAQGSSLDKDRAPSSSNLLRKDKDRSDRIREHRSDRVERDHRRSRSHEKMVRKSSENDYNRSERNRSERDRIERDRSERERNERDRSEHREHDRVERDRIDRDRIIERDRRARSRSLRRPNSRESYQDDESPPHFTRDDHEPPDYYAHGNPYKWTPNQPKPHYYVKPYPAKHPSAYYGRETVYVREIPATGKPRHYEEKPEPEIEPDEPLTVVAVLRLLTALEELLGPSLGPKIIDLLAKALALEKVKANSADDLLLNEDNCVLFETVKEKLKGQLIAEVVEKHQMKAVKRAIKNVAGVIHFVSEKEKNKTPEEKQQEIAQKESLTPKPSVSLPSVSSKSTPPVEDKNAIAMKIAAALVAQGKTDITKEELETLTNYVIDAQRKAKEGASKATTAGSVAETKQPGNHLTDNTNQKAPPSTNAKANIDKSKIQIDDQKKDHEEEFDLPQDASSALESLTDTDLQTLLQNFRDLSAEEQQHLIAYLKKLEAVDPSRVEKLRKYVDVVYDIQDADSNDRTDNEKRSTPMDSDKIKPSAKVAKKSQIQPYDDIFFDDSAVSNDKKSTAPAVIDSDDDDDDYSYDDVFKAASKNVKEKQKANENENRRNSPRFSTLESYPAVAKHDQFFLNDDDDEDRSGKKLFDDNRKEISTASRASGEDSNSRNQKDQSALDPESIIANLMGSLKNVQRSYADRNVGDAPDNNDLHSVPANNQTNRPQIQSNVPFYLQQQQQQQQQHPEPPLVQNPKTSSQFFMNEFNLAGYPSDQDQRFPPANPYQNPGYNSSSQMFNNSQAMPNIPLNIRPFVHQQQQNQQQQQSQMGGIDQNLFAQIQQHFGQQQHQQQNQQQPQQSQFGSNNQYGRFF